MKSLWFSALFFGTVLGFHPAAALAQPYVNYSFIDINPDDGFIYAESGLVFDDEHSLYYKAEINSTLSGPCGTRYRTVVDNVGNGVAEAVQTWQVCYVAFTYTVSAHHFARWRGPEHWDYDLGYTGDSWQVPSWPSVSVTGVNADPPTWATITYHITPSVLTASYIRINGGIQNINGSGGGYVDFHFDQTDLAWGSSTIEWRGNMYGLTSGPVTTYANASTHQRTDYGTQTFYYGGEPPVPVFIRGDFGAGIGARVITYGCSSSGRTVKAEPGGVSADFRNNYYEYVPDGVFASWTHQTDYEYITTSAYTGPSNNQDVQWSQWVELNSQAESDNNSLWLCGTLGCTVSGGLWVPLQMTMN